MKKNTSYILIFLLGAVFGAFMLFNFWQPGPRSVAPRKTTDFGQLIKVFEKSIDDITMGSVGVRGGEIVEKITKTSVILEMDVKNIDNSSVNIEVKSGQVKVSGKARFEQSNGGLSRATESSFSRTYPVPEGTDASGLRLEYINENILQMIFPKK